MDEKRYFVISKRVQAIMLGSISGIIALLVLRGQVIEGYEPIGALFGLTSTSIAVLCWWYIFGWPTTVDHACYRYAVRGGKIIGGICLLAGYVGPIILTPDANSGPLFGIFISGPIGFVVGMLSGIIYGLFRTHDTPKQAL